MNEWIKIPDLPQSASLGNGINAEGPCLVIAWEDLPRFAAWLQEAESIVEREYARIGREALTS